MRSRQIRVFVEKFEKISVGDLFVLLPLLKKPTPPPVLYRKITPYQEFNAIAEFHEGESCDRGLVKFDDCEEVILLQ